MFIFKVCVLWFAGCVRESIALALHLNVRLRGIMIICLFSKCVCCGLQGVSGRVIALHLNVSLRLRGMKMFIFKVCVLWFAACVRESIALHFKKMYD